MRRLDFDCVFRPRPVGQGRKDDVDLDDPDLVAAAKAAKTTPRELARRIRAAQSECGCGG